MEDCARIIEPFKFDKVWRRFDPDNQEGLPMVKEDHINRKVGFSWMRKFSHKKWSRKLKVGETRQWRAGFMMGRWEGWVFSDTMVMCLNDDGNCYTPKAEDPVPAFKSQDWTGPGTLTGTTTVTTDQYGRSKLRVDGTYKYEGERDDYLGLGLFVAMSTRNGQTEWSAESWDPNSGVWLFFSSHNTCPIEDIERCSRNHETFKWDRDWRKVSFNEDREKKLITFSHERDFAHWDYNRQLKLDETRKMRAGYVSGVWQNFSYSPEIEIKLTDGINTAHMGIVAEKWQPT